MKLRPYQQEDVEFLAALNRAACFNEQRTGKTPTLCEVAKKRKVKKSVIICPGSGMLNWAQHWGDLVAQPSIIVEGTRKQRTALLDNWQEGALVISYDAIKKTSRTEGFIDQVLKHRPDSAILDEAHRINGRTTAVAKSIFKLTKIPIRYALTGTPTKGRAYEIWSILHWLYPEYFRSYWKFIDEYFVTWEMNLPSNPLPIKQIEGFKPGKEQQLWKVIAQFSTQRKRINIMPWLPEKDHQHVLLQPTSQQIKYINDLEEWFTTETLSVPNILTQLLRIRQICLTPTLIGLSSAQSPKTQWILSFLKDYPEKKIIIFSKFRSYLTFLQNHLIKQKISHAALWGGMKQAEIKQIQKKFQAGRTQVLLIQIDVGKECLTLDNADAIIFTDKYPPIGDIEQAEDRFVATTRDKASKPHTIYELILQGTYDEVIHEMLIKRKAETDLINNYKNLMERRKNDTNTSNTTKRQT